MISARHMSMDVEQKEFSAVSAAAAGNASQLASAAFIRHTAGHKIWTDWVELGGLRDARCVTMFDKHDVVDTLD